VVDCELVEWYKLLTSAKRRTGSDSLLGHHSSVYSLVVSVFPSPTLLCGYVGSSEARDDLPSYFPSSAFTSPYIN